MLKTELAKRMLMHQAVKLSPQNPFTWASGIKSPIYCDQRILLSYPDTRDLIIKAYVALIKKDYPEVQAIVGTATSGIPYGAIIADHLNLPFAYVRASQKNHGRKQKIEGDLKAHSHVLVIEDLISTGKSVLEVVDILQKEGHTVQAVLANFSYQLKKADENFAKYNVNYQTLTNINVLLDIASQEKFIEREDYRIITAFLKNNFK